MKYITKLYCPICGEEMSADVHAPADGGKWNSTYPDISTEKFRKMDNWICLRQPNHHCVVFTPEDIEDWVEEEME